MRLCSRASPAAPELACHDSRRDKLAVALLPLGEYPITRLQVSQVDRLTVFDEFGLFVHHHSPFTLPRIAHLDLISVYGDNLAACAIAAEALHVLIGDASHDRGEEFLIVIGF